MGFSLGVFGKDEYVRSECGDHTFGGHNFLGFVVAIPARRLHFLFVRRLGKEFFEYIYYPSQSFRIFGFYRSFRFGADNFGGGSNECPCLFALSFQHFIFWFLVGAFCGESFNLRLGAGTFYHWHNSALRYGRAGPRFWFYFPHPAL